MTDGALFLYEIIVTLAAFIAGLLTVVALLTQASWLDVSAGSFISIWTFIFFTSIPVVNWHDHVCEGEQAPHH